MLETEGALHTRIVVSPLAITLCHALAAVRVPHWRFPSDCQIEIQRRADPLDLRALSVLQEPTPCDFLLPLPWRSGLTIREELEALRATPQPVIERDLQAWPGLHSPPPAYDVFEDDPRGALGAYAEALDRVWSCLLAARWPAIQRVLERAVLLLGHTLATRGVAALIDELHPSVSYDGGVVRVDTDHRFPGPVATAGRPLVLLPLVCGLDGLMINDDLPDATVIGFPARGIGELWGAPARPPHRELVTLLGRSRARIAVCLSRPATTSDLAARLRLAPSTVSAHLAWLCDAGLADRVRLGAPVYYRLTPRGEALLHLFCA